MRIRALLMLLCLVSLAFPAESWKTHYESGLQLLDQGKYDEAQERFKAGIAENPGSSELHNALGLVALQTGEPRAAVTSFERALELRAEDLRKAAHAIGRITGRIDVEDVLDAVFGRFCIGK